LTNTNNLHVENEQLRQRVTELEQKCDEYTRALQQQEDELQLYKLLIENSPDGIGISDINGIFTHANPAYQKMTGYGAEMIGMSVSTMSKAMDAADIIPILFEHGYWKDYFLFSRKDGTTFQGQMSVFVARDSQGNIYGLPAIVRDVTEQVERERDLQNFRQLVDRSPDAIALSQPDGTMTYANPAYRNLSGYGDAIIGMKFYEHYDPNDRKGAEEAVQKISEQGYWTGILRWRQKNGTLVQVHGTVFMTSFSEGEQTFAGIFRDITEQQHTAQEHADLQQQLIETQQAAIRELSTPLIPIADDVVIMPIIGTIDSQRAQQVMETLLEGIAHYHAETVILDVTGVQVMDTQIANAFIRSAKAARLLGAKVVMTGIQPQMAQTLVHLGIDMSDIITRSTLQAGITYALK
jgi:rsbT co-antagonist protein RsbR